MYIKNNYANLVTGRHASYDYTLLSFSVDLNYGQTA